MLDTLVDFLCFIGEVIYGLVRHIVRSWQLATGRRPRDKSDDFWQDK